MYVNFISDLIMLIKALYLYYKYALYKYALYYEYAYVQEKQIHIISVKWNRVSILKHVQFVSLQNIDITWTDNML